MQSRLSGARLWLTVIIPFALGFFIAVVFRNINAILAHPLMESMNLSPMEVGFVTSTFMLTFALTQIPLGVVLDYLGARKTQTVLFVIGGIGIIIFGLATNVWHLALGRAVLGIGMAGGLMAAFKAISDTVSKDREPFYNGIILAAGGLGALIATTPAKLLEVEFGWRALCIGLGVVAFLIALLIFFANRNASSTKAGHSTLRGQVVDLKSIYADRFFWRIAPLFVISFGGFLAMQGLWLGSWLQHIVGLSPLESAKYLSVVAIAMTLGMLSGGLFSKLADRMKWPLTVVIVIGIAVHIATQAAIVTNVLSSYYVIWFVYGYFAQVALVNFAVIEQHFGPELSGRATTSVNMLIFLFAFLVQYLFGLVVHLWAQSSGVDHPIIAYKVAFSVVIALESAALAWFIVSGRTSNAESRA